MTLSVEGANRAATDVKASETVALAQVRVAVALSDQETEALRSALVRVFHRPLELEVETMPEILGGVWVRVGDTVIDGSLRGKLETLRHHLRSQCNSLLTAGMWTELKVPNP